MDEIKAIHLCSQDRGDTSGSRQRRKQKVGANRAGGVKSVRESESMVIVKHEKIGRVATRIFH